MDVGEGRGVRNGEGMVRHWERESKGAQAGDVGEATIVNGKGVDELVVTGMANQSFFSQYSIVSLLGWLEVAYLAHFEKF